METKIKNASVKVMLSYDYSHFEASVSLENDNGLTVKEIDAARKDCQRLADKAVAQYKTAKAQAASGNDGQYKMKNFEAECTKIKANDEQDRTLKEIANKEFVEDLLAYCRNIKAKKNPKDCKVFP